MTTNPRSALACASLLVLGACGLAETESHESLELQGSAEDPMDLSSFPTDVEPCDGFDNDVDGHVDEGCSCLRGERRTCYPGPEETLGVGVCRAGVMRCLARGDFDVGVWGPCEGARVPAQEICGNGIDEGCDGVDADCGGGDSNQGIGAP